MDSLVAILNLWGWLTGGGALAVALGYGLIILGSFKMLESGMWCALVAIGIPLELAGTVAFQVGMCMGFVRLVIWLGWGL